MGTKTAVHTAGEKARNGCVDLFLERNGGRLWVNEANTIPGFTSISMFPRLWGLSGLEYPALLDELIRIALERAS